MTSRPIAASDLTGTLPVSTWMVSNAGIFTNLQANLNYQVNINSINFATEYSNAFAGNHQTDALSAGVVVPNGATVWGTNAVAGYIVSNRSGAGIGGDVAGFFMARAGVNNANIWGINAVATDGMTGTLTGVTLQQEFDFNVSNASTIVKGNNAVLFATAQPTSAVAFRVQAVNANKWTEAFISTAGAATVGLDLGPTGTGANSPSQNIKLGGFDAGGLGRVSQIYSDQDGNLVLRSGQNGKAVALQDYNSGGGTNLLIVDTAGIASSVNISAPSLTTTPVAVSALPAVGPFVGTRTFVNNSTVAASGNFGTIVAGGGANTVPVYSDGTNWRIG